MGVDLYLLPFDCDDPDLSFSHTILDCERERALFGLISIISIENGIKVPDGFTGFLSRKSNGESGYGEIKEDPYGDPVKYVDADKLIEIWKSEYDKNKAILSYLKCLPNNTKVALFWH